MDGAFQAGTRPFDRRRSSAFAFAFALALLISASPALAAGRKGAQVVIETGLSRSPIRGELIAVKPDSLLILDDLGADTSVELTYVRLVRVARRSKAVGGAFLGLLAGAGAGYGGGYATAISAGACPDCEARLSAFVWGMIGGAVGLGVGCMMGEAAGRDVIIPIGGLSRSDLTVQLKKLRRYARVVGPL